MMIEKDGMKMQISVIVPIYNVEKYIKRCLDSILGQSYKNMEIILVDDGSTDNCVKICEEYKKLDSRIIVIHKANGGLVSARKAGIQVAKGEFIGWVDGDDWIEPYYFEQMVKAQLETGADLVVSNHFHDIGKDSKKIYNYFQVGVYTKEQLLPKLLYTGNFFEYGLQPHIWSKLFRKDKLKNVQMGIDDRIIVGEDAAVIYASVLEAHSICITDICGYHYMQNGGSITKIELKDEIERYQLLFNHLEMTFKAKEVFDILNYQLEQYKKYLLFLRQMSIFDEQVLLPYGGIPKNSRVILYGAGVLGQKMHQYLSEIESMSIVLWVDKNYRNYMNEGFDVKNPDLLSEVENYDYILIANTVQSVADSIVDALFKMKIPKNKIRWFSKDFIYFKEDNS